MDCIRCGYENESGARFCANCGSELQQSCKVCGAAISPDAKFCNQCGAPVGTQSDRLSTIQQSASPELQEKMRRSI